jgi:hypothetical protein
MIYSKEGVEKKSTGTHLPSVYCLKVIPIETEDAAVCRLEPLLRQAFQSKMVLLLESYSETITNRDKSGFN